MQIAKLITIGVKLVSVMGMLIIWGNSGLVVQAQDPDWSKPVVVSPKSEPGVYHWFPEIVADLEGNIHLFWVSAREVKNNQYKGYDTVLHCVVKDEVCSNPSEIVAYDWHAGINATRPMAVVDKRNIIHLLTRGVTGVEALSQIYYQQAPANQASLTTAWSEPRRISGGKGATYYSDIVVDTKGNVHVIWNEIVPPSDPQLKDACFVCSDIFYRHSSDDGQTWSILNDLTNSDTEERKLQLLIDDQDRLFIFWEEELYNSLNNVNWQPATSGVMNSLNAGDKWSLPTRFIFPSGAPQHITAGIDGQNKLVAVWALLEGREIYYQTSLDQGQSWSPPRSIPGVLSRTRDNNWDTYHMVPDSAGNLHLVLVGRLANYNLTTSSVFHLEWDGKAWSEPEEIFTVSGDLPEWPRIAIANGNQLHVTWFVRNQGNLNDPGETSQYKIWYAHGQSQAPAITPALPPTPTVTPSPTTIPELLVTSTPTVDPALKQVSSVPVGAIDSIYTDNDDLLLLAQSLIPTVLILVLVVVGVRVWRH